MPNSTTLTALLTLALTTTPTFAQNAPPSEPEFLPNTASTAPFSRAVQVGDTLYLAGQLGLPRRVAETQDTGIEAETRRAMERIGETLGEYGLGHDALFKCTVWLADIDDFAGFNAVYRTYFDEWRYPVRSTMAVKELAGGARVEIECTAYAASATRPKGNFDWSMMEAHFRAGEAQSPGAFDKTAALVCVGRWRLHADAVDDGAFPAHVAQSLPQQLRLREAIGAAEYFRPEVLDRAIMRPASDEAEARLRAALVGDAEAFREYFEALGRCSTKPETVRDDGVG